MASTMTATTMGADGHLGGPLAPKQVEEEAHTNQEPAHQHLPQHLESDGRIEDDCQDEIIGESNDGNVSNGDKEREGMDFNHPTPLHKNHGFFKESQSELQKERPDGSNAEDGQLAANPIEPQSQNIDDGATASTEPDSAALSQSPEQVHQSPIATRRKRRVAAAVIEGDASTAFSHYLPVAPLSSLPGNTVRNNIPDNKVSPKRKRGKRRRDKRDHKKDTSDSVGDSNGSDEKRPRDGSDGIDGSASSLISDGDALQTNAQHVGDRTASGPRSNDPIHILEAEDDPILHNYLPQLAFLNDNYYSRVKPYRMGRRDLPLNQIEVILRRRAVKKRADMERESNANGAATGRGSGKEGAGSKRGSRSINPPPPSGRPPLQHQHSPPRRKLFPTQQQRSPTSSFRNSGHYEDDSTISSMSVTSQTTPAVSIQQPSMPLPTPHQQPDISSGNTAIAISEIPKEEVVGDTSLGLKLTILQGKVIVQNITALEDGRASPAQLCGLISIGDIIVAVNGKSLIKGSVHNPVGMDRIISVLKPLSQPMNEEAKEYSREVRLRFALGEGKPLLREQKEREQRKIEERMHRKKLGLDGARGTVDPAADLFGIGALMGVDQHSGMPMFGHLDHRQHRDSEGDDKEEKKEGDGSAEAVLVEEEKVQVSAGKPGEKQITRFSRARPSVQAQIARQVQLDRQWNRNRITSGFFAMDSKAPILLRPPPPPPDHSDDAQMVNSMDGRKLRLERGAQTVVEATSLVAMVEAQDNGIEAFEDEDPMEVASRVCGTASIRTGASKRRWHRGDAGTSITEGDATSAVSGASSMELNTSIRSGESLVEACDHRLLVELAANNDSWKANVLKRLESYAEETEKESNISLHRGSSDSSGKEEVAAAATGFDGFLFGGDVASMLGKKKHSLALPPGEMTSMLYDLVELLEGGLPDQIFMKDESLPNGPEKAVSFANGNHLEKSADVAKATDFLVDNALGKWLKSFRPLPWKQRRALWPPQQYGGDADSTYASSRLDDNESLSLMSGTTAARSREKDKRNLRELIEDLELDHETRRETCRLATFYFTNKYSTSQAGLSPDAEEEAAAFIDAYGSYLDIYKCLVFAGGVHSKALVDKLVGVAKYDPQHKEAVKALQKAKVLLFYEPNMLSALIEMLPSIASKQVSSNFDFVALLVSAYPDLQPWCVHEASHSDHSGGFYEEYLSSLMHDEEGNDAAKRDKELVKEWCWMLCNESDSAMKQTYRQNFFHIATKDSERSLVYYRDLPFLLDVSVKMSEFGLTLSLANEIVLNPRYCRDEQVLRDVLEHLFVVIDKAIEGNEGEINAVLLGEVITFFNIISPCMEEHGGGFDNVAELSKLLEQCYTEQQTHSRYSSSNIDTCLAIISENAPPDHSLQVLSQWDHTAVDSPALISALHASLVRGAREGIRSEISGSLLRIQRAREEGRRPMVDTAMMSWTADADELGEDQEGEGCIWSNVLDGTLAIAK